jgi:hypothetical protein
MYVHNNIKSGAIISSNLVDEALPSVYNSVNYITDKIRVEYTALELVETGGQRLKAPSASPVERPPDRLPKKFGPIKE